MIGEVMDSLLILMLNTVRAARERTKENGLLSSLGKYHGDKTGEHFRLWHETWLSESFAH